MPHTLLLAVIGCYVMTCIKCINVKCILFTELSINYIKVYCTLHVFLQTLILNFHLF